SMNDLLAAIEEKLPQDPNLDPSVTRRGRRLLSMSMLALAATVVTVLAARGRMNETSTRGLLVIACVIFGATLLAMAVFRKKLVANLFGARATGVALLGVGSLVAHRLVALHFDQPPEQVIAVDTLMLGLELALAAFLLARWFAWGAAA